MQAGGDISKGMTNVMSAPVFPVLVIVVMAWYIACSFLDVWDMSIDTIFQVCLVCRCLSFAVSVVVLSLPLLISFDLFVFVFLNCMSCDMLFEKLEQSPSARGNKKIFDRGLTYEGSASATAWTKSMLKHTEAAGSLVTRKRHLQACRM